MPARIDRMLIAALTALAPCLVAAQAPQWPTPQDIDRALKASPLPGGARLRSQPVPQPPRIDATPGGIDIEALASRKIQLPSAGTGPGANASPLRIFITLDMPRASLQLLTEQASRTGAVLVLRGLKAQSMRETLRAVSDLVGDRTVAWVIDPEAFTRFGVAQAPTFVLAPTDAGTGDAQRGCSAGCATPATFVSVVGDVSLDYALTFIARAKPTLAQDAERYLKRLAGAGAIR